MFKSSESAKITIGGTEYPVDALSDKAKAHLKNISFCDQRLLQLKNEWSIADTARMAYSAALKREKLS